MFLCICLSLLKLWHQRKWPYKVWPYDWTFIIHHTEHSTALLSSRLVHLDNEIEVVLGYVVQETLDVRSDLDNSDTEMKITGDTATVGE